MDGPQHTLWQERWSGVANRLERALENTAYRFILCCATVALIVGYAAVASRIAEPPRFVESRYIRIVEPQTSPMTAHDVDLLNRSVARLQKLASVLNLTPKHLTIRPSVEVVRAPYAVEYQVLRLWIDEARGFYSGGKYEMISESIARAIIATTFGNDARPNLPPTSASWYEQVKFRDGLAIPPSLSLWLTSQLIAESERHSVGARIGYLRKLVQSSANPRLLEYELENRWPATADKFGPLLQNILNEIAPLQAAETDFRPILAYLEVKLGDREKSTEGAAIGGVHVGLLVVTSCKTPRLADFREFDAREVVWARVCPKSLSAIISLVPAQSAEQFAEKNPDVSFVQLGLAEISYALAQGWIDSKTDVSDFVIGMKENGGRVAAYQVRPQREEWVPKAQAFRVKAPIEVLKLMRLRSI